MKLRLVGVAAVLLVAGGCTTMKEVVRARAAADFSCSEIRIDELLGDAFVASGCEKKATYVCVRPQTLGAPVSCLKNSETSGAK